MICGFILSISGLDVININLNSFFGNFYQIAYNIVRMASFKISQNGKYLFLL